MAPLYFFGAGMVIFWFGWLNGYCVGRGVTLRFKWPFYFRNRKVRP